jgi:hypothetical protein
MKKRKNLSAIIIYLFVLGTFFSTSFLQSCKDPEPPIAEVTVLDTAGLPVADARVILYCTTPECVVADTQKTNSMGVSNHKLALPAVLAISVFKSLVVTKDTGTFPNIGTVTTGDSICGSGYITLREDEIAKQTVIALPCIE